MKEIDSEILQQVQLHDEALRKFVRHAVLHRRVNTFLLIITIMIVATNFWRSIIVSRAIQQNFELSYRNSQGVAEVKATQDLYRQQYLDYIRDMIDSMNELQRENPKLKVPRAPVPRSVLSKDQKHATEEYLRRLPQTGPCPTPVVKTKVKIKRVLVTPTPKPFLNWFKSTR